jgi:hypothetical protein
VRGRRGTRGHDSASDPTVTAQVANPEGIRGRSALWIRNRPTRYRPGTDQVKVRGRSASRDNG